jgi:hypothetical protein
VSSDLEQQLTQLDELLGLLDSGALKAAQETLEHHISELSERLEVTRQALAQAQAQRRRLARARLLLEEPAHEPNGNGDPALRPAPEPAPDPDPQPVVESSPQPVAVPSSPPMTGVATAPFVAERRRGEERRVNGERRQTEDRRRGQQLPPSA